MFNSKSPVVKFVGYLIIGFFLLIIIISFGMPDMGFQLGLDSATAAVVNGKKLHTLDYIRYRDDMLRQYPFLRNQQSDSLILDRFIAQELLYQYTQKIGLTASDERIGNAIKTYFQNPDTGKYSADTLKNYLNRSNLSFAKFESNIRRDLALNDLNLFLFNGITITKNEANREYICRNSKLQIRYAFLSKADIRKRYASVLAVTDNDINKEIEANPSELKDPQTDRERIKEIILNRRVSEIENDLTSKINTISAAGGSFAAASATLSGTPGTSAVFSIGEPLKDLGKDGMSLPSIETSKIFKETCLSLAIGQSSKVIQSSSGLYIFTPVLKQVDFREPSADKRKDLSDEMQYQVSNSLMNNIMRDFYEKSKIIKNLKDE